MSPFQQLVRQLLKTKKTIDRNLTHLKQRADEVDNKYAPRNEFNRWKKSEAGKAWKRDRYQKQKGRCAECACAVLLKGSHIDHIKPLAHFPELAIDPKNLRILCPACNVQKGAQETV
ncbi:MAG: HNH endonuclease signature motif containing protein [Cyanobacteria bacterium J06598_3]